MLFDLLCHDTVSSYKERIHLISNIKDFKKYLKTQLEKRKEKISTPLHVRKIAKLKNYSRYLFNISYFDSIWDLRSKQESSYHIWYKQDSYP